jgi:hypothetical protein
MGDFIIKWGMWAGPDYAGGKFANGLNFKDETDLMFKAYFPGTSTYVAPTSYLDGAARIHDLGYWYAEDQLRQGLTQQFHVESVGLLTTEQKTSPVYLDLMKGMKNAYNNADLVLVQNILQYKPPNAIESAYRDLMLSTFVLKSMLLNGGDVQLGSLLPKLQEIAPGLQLPSTVSTILNAVPEVAKAAYWMYTGLQDLAISGLSAQEMGLLNQHLTSALNLEQPGYPQAANPELGVLALQSKDTLVSFPVDPVTHRVIWDPVTNLATANVTIDGHNS